ncbi:hypothetical protein CAEBREN_16810 [Caenorhabditis brenneri]|uniref:Proteasomal ubiquitin receptor ADRM1 homolog n=1 Tax=Caenorhabditis brenneri TaxID=135651 RepID=G0N2V8_CAEBE|nr:hypothetical protein CAEBREN_16810 [Caenorhabditis brenneri]
MAMFSNTRTTAPSSGHIVEFKAGRSRLEPGSGGDATKKVIAEAAKGLVFIKQSNDMLVHFCWKNRETGALVDDLIIFPDDAEFKAVTGCPDGKVFMLKFKSSGEMKLFWLQDPSPDADKDLIKKVNDALNKPATSRPSGAARSSGSGAERPSAGGTSAAAAGAQDFNGMGGLDQSQLMSLIQSLQGNESMAALTSSGGGGSSTAAATAGTEAASSEADCEPTGESTSSSNPLSLDNPAIRMAFSNLAKKEARGLKKVFVPLAEVLSNEQVAEIARQHAEELTPLLPPSENPEQELSETVRTPQFRQAADTLGTALQTAQLRPVLEQFGMHPTVLEAADEGSLLRFAREMTRTEGGHHVEDSSPESGVPKTQPEDEDVAREPEPKRNRPDDMDDMDVD